MPLSNDYVTIFEQGKIDLWYERIQETMHDLQELSAMGFFPVGERYAVEQLYANPELWSAMKALGMTKFVLKGIEKYFGVVLSEGKDAVEVFSTKDPRWQIQVKHYPDLQIGYRYDLVRIL